MDELRARGVRIPASEFDVRFSRASGPGGQNVNKRDTRVEVVLDLHASRALSAAMKARAAERLGARIDARGRIHVVSGAARTQAENRRIALARMSHLLSEALRPPPRPRRATKPSRSAVERRIKGKKARGAVKRLRSRPLAGDD